MTGRLRAATGAALVLVGLSVALPAQDRVPTGDGDVPRLSPTAHAPVPTRLTALWHAPAPGGPLSAPLADFVRGVRLLDDEDKAAAALPLLSQGALSRTNVADYARFYTARALRRLDRLADAEAAFAAVAARTIEGHLPEDAALGQAEAREAQRDFAGAVAVYEALLPKRLAQPHVVLARLAIAAEAANDPSRAIDAYRRVYFEYPLSTEAMDADKALTRLNAWDEDESMADRELKRADTLFAARRWTAAYTSYERARAGAGDRDRQRIDLRMAAADVQLKRFKQAEEPLRGLRAGDFADEAGFYYISALRGLGRRDTYETEARAFADQHRDSPFAEELLNNLASHFIIADEDGRADEVFRLLIARYPGGRYTERAYWRSGWWAFRDDKFADAAALFDRGASQFPRSDYRPAWLYWAGRAWREIGNHAAANQRFLLAATDYANVYHGRLARRHLDAAATEKITPPFARVDTDVAPVSFPTATRISQLIAVGLHREALSELQYAQRMWGDSPSLTATVALVQNRLGNLRLGINAMKRAYPQWMAAGGDTLPFEIQKVVFPLDYWPLLQKHAAVYKLDPYLVAALVAQESTFDPVIRSSANAVGLMQVLPSTGRQFARRLKITGFTAARLTHPETNVRLGTAIFAEGVRKFGGVHFALAAYNAGDSRVAAWQRERPGMPQDVFIEDIPFPETQNYVKRILGTAEDYRRLYGGK
ncbi:MAG: transglycosylase SLT domain-containing protein [Acidobacteria bacterium]|nr:transglycosylase SLT domain-containing protein [Acidobacteriota bacterium]